MTILQQIKWFAIGFVSAILFGICYLIFKFFGLVLALILLGLVVIGIVTAFIKLKNGINNIQSNN